MNKIMEAGKFYKNSVNGKIVQCVDSYGSGYVVRQVDSDYVYGVYSNTWEEYEMPITPILTVTRKDRPKFKALKWEGLAYISYLKELLSDLNGVGAIDLGTSSLLIKDCFDAEICVVNVNEWVVVTPKGKIKRYTDEEFNKKFTRDK